MVKSLNHHCVPNSWDVTKFQGTWEAQRKWWNLKGVDNSKRSQISYLILFQRGRTTMKRLQLQWYTITSKGYFWKMNVTKITSKWEDITSNSIGNIRVENAFQPSPMWTEKVKPNLSISMHMWSTLDSVGLSWNLGVNYKISWNLGFCWAIDCISSVYSTKALFPPF